MRIATLHCNSQVVLCSSNHTPRLGRWLQPPLLHKGELYKELGKVPCTLPSKVLTEADGLASAYTAVNVFAFLTSTKWVKCYEEQKTQPELVPLIWNFTSIWNNGIHMAGFCPLWGFPRLRVSFSAGTKSDAKIWLVKLCKSRTNYSLPITLI